DAELSHAAAGPSRSFRQCDPEPAQLGVLGPLGPPKSLHLRSARQRLPALKTVVLSEELIQAVVQELTLLGGKARHRPLSTLQSPRAPLARMFFCTSLEPP